MQDIQSQSPSPGNSWTRREFLGQIGLASPLLLFPDRHLSADTQKDEKPEFVFALVSDNHLGRGGEGPSTRMKAVVGEINASPAELTLFCGDLVDQGQKAQNQKRYPEWAEIAGGLSKPYHAIPGNHDPDSMFTKHIRKETDFVVEHRSFRFLCFKDAEQNPGHDGVVTKEQRQWLQKQIDEAGRKRQRVILVAHVIYHENRHPDVGWYIKTNRKEFGELLAANSRHLTAFFAGHFHCGVRGWHDNHGLHEVILPSTAWNRDRGLEKAPGYSLKEFRDGYVIVKVFKDRLSLEYKPIGEKVMARKDLPLRG